MITQIMAAITLYKVGKFTAKNLAIGYRKGITRRERDRIK